MLRDWEREQPGRTDRIFQAIGDIVPSHLMDRNLHPFTSLQQTGEVNAAGDRAFDEEEFEACRPGSSEPIDEAKPIAFSLTHPRPTPASPSRGD